MSTEELAIRLSDLLPTLFECTPAPQEGVRVRTPLLFPDGGVIDVFVLERNATYTLTDFGDAAGWLGLQTVSQQRSQKQRLLMKDTCQTLGIELRGETLVLQGVPTDGLADAVLRLAQAEARVADLWFTMRQIPGESTADEINDWLLMRQFEVDRRIPIAGKSSRMWTIDFRTRTPNKESLVFLLSTGTRGATRRIVEHVVAGFHDLRSSSLAGTNVSYVSLFDDTVDIWRDEDFGLAESLSDIARWSRPDELAELLESSG
ncbi:MAG: DUF1828 domain-containing protein [Chloroflexi bacterium]|nr:DUF1828 domain-containing protein [Chloroflexota bacterium]